MTSTVQKILDSELQSPTWAFRPSLAAPIRSDMTLTRPDNNATGSGPDPTAQTLDPYTTDYVAKGADQPRIYGKDQALLLEGNRTNVVGDSSDFDPSNTDWMDQTGITFMGNYQSVIDGGTAGKIKTDSGANTSNGHLYNVGQTISGVETLSSIFYRGSADTFSFGVRTPAGSDLAHFEYDWTTDTLTDGGYESGSTTERYSRRFDRQGPDAEDVVLIVLKYNHTSGVDRQLTFNPDLSASGKHTFINHVQLEEQPQHTTPIRGGGTATTRGQDSLSVDKSSWWNDKEMTCLVEFVPMVTELSSSFEFVIGWSGNIRLRGSDPFRARFSAFDSNGNVFVKTIDNDNVNAFRKNKMAISVTRNEYRAASNGATAKNSHDGNSLTDNNDIIFNAKDGNPILYYNVRFYPKAFPLTSADRSAGDPLSLETLTKI